MKKLGLNFYLSNDVVLIAKNLLGKILVTKFNDEATTGRIVEVEAYNGENDKASHAFGGRRTKRTEIMFAEGGVAYVYLCYGIHYLFNVVTNHKNIPHAILIRAVEPIKGVEMMLKRTQKKKLDFSLTKGPGNVSKALGLHTNHSGVSLLSKELFIAEDGFVYDDKEIIASPRIGVDYAAEDAKLNYRFFVKGNLFVSGIRNLPADRQVGSW